MEKKQQNSEIEIRFSETKTPEMTSTDIRDLTGLIQAVSSAPTWSPRKFSEQFAVYASGATYRFYIYDSTNKAWRYVALT